MNLFKLALCNIKKSINDYVVYFITLIIGVAIFYVFSSVGEQSYLKEIAGTQYELIELLLVFLDVISVAVAFVLGFLIIYANNFLIKRRKKEFGVYRILGMSKGSVSRILVYETVAVGVISLIIGLVIGVFCSQFMSILVGKLFEADMSEYAFVISKKAIIKTIINFVVIYIIVLLFHSRTIAKYKLIDLFSASKKSEKQLLKNPVASSIVFVITMGFIGYSYYRIGYNADEIGSGEFICHIVVCLVGTILLFWSLSGFLLSMLQKCKGMYHKNLNSFVIRQFCSSINSSAITMGMICIMLFFTICTFTAGFSVVKQLQDNLDKVTPVDYSIVYKNDETMKEALAKRGLDNSKLISKEHVEVSVLYAPSFTFEESLGSGVEEAKKLYPYAEWNESQSIMSLSDYNAVAKLYGNKTIELKENEYAVICDYDMMIYLRNISLEKEEVLKINSVELKPAYKSCVEGYIVMAGSSVNSGIIVVSDEVVEQDDFAVKNTEYLFAGNYDTKRKSEKEELDIELLKATKDVEGFRTVETKISIIQASNGITVMLSFIVIYLGVVFLISSAALLAMKALSESIDSEGKYTILKKIGSDKGMLCKALFAQIGAYFGLPMLVACIHSIFGLKMVECMFIIIMKKGASEGILVSAIIVGVFYGGYFFTTYKRSKKIVGI